jgi:N-acetylmuramoyl-L-alanine amidase
VKLRGLLLSILGVLIFDSPADAGQLVSWEFEKEQNRLVFITDQGVQPRAKLIGSPTRLVIELPGTSLGRTTVKETYSGAIRGFRIGQSTDNVVSLVIELAPGYTIDPERVEFRGLTPTEWTVELPSPRVSDLPQETQLSESFDDENGDNSSDRYISTRSSLEPPNSRIQQATLDRTPQASDRESGSYRPLLPESRISSNRNQLTTLDKNEPIEKPLQTPAVPQLSKSPYVKITSHGFFINLEGDRREKLDPVQNGDTIEFELPGVTLPSDLESQSVAVNEFGVEEIAFIQQSPSVATMSLKVSPDSSEWRAIFSRVGGLILVPVGERAIAKNQPIQLAETQPDSQLNDLTTTIHAIDLTNNDTQLSIRSNGDLLADSKMVGNGTHEIVINNARLGEPFAGPELRADSPITELKVREEGSSVVLSITTKLGIRLGTVRNGTNLIALPIVIPPSTVSVPSANLPMPTRSKPLVLLDPGHGGQDPGTVGIGGVQEKNVILPISLDVAEELRKQGIEVRLTRDRDYFISLEGRTALANQVDADLFVSIHANAINLSRPDVNGLETYYYQSGRRLAEIIHYNILNSVNIQDRNIRRARFFVLRHSEMPAVLVEVGFLTGVQDASDLKDPEHRRQMAKAIARGIVQYIKENRI